RIQNVIRELSGERIDILKYDTDPSVFIKNSLSPAQVLRVHILDPEKREALAVVEESQLSLAIGKNGQNVRLANKLCDWNIDVKTEAQAKEMDLSQTATMQAVRNLFNHDDEKEEQGNLLSELPDVDSYVVAILAEHGIEYIEQFISAYDNDSLNSISGLQPGNIDAMYELIKNNVQFVEADEETEEDAEEEYRCPECNAVITLDMTHCPECGVEFEFQEDEE
ncbi:MAG: transcription termination/antitermination protein NusA, partial [Treponema sp.]|nr:transcription termination/antitermination protein NusA [Treponema sp.]